MLTFVVIMSLIVTGSNLEKSYQVAAQNELYDCCEKKVKNSCRGGRSALCECVCMRLSVCLSICVRGQNDAHYYVSRDLMSSCFVLNECIERQGD